MIEWARQVGKGKSELELNADEAIALFSNKKSKVIILFYPIEVFLSRLFLTIPAEFGGMGVVGKNYEAIKDYLEWNGLNVKKYTPLLVQMGQVWANEINSKEG